MLATSGAAGADAPVLCDVARHPAASEHLIEGENRVQPLELVVEKRVTRREQTVLGHEHRLEFRHPFAVAHLRDAERLFSGRKARSRDLRLLFEQLNVAERDLYFTEGDEHGLAIKREAVLNEQLGLLDVA